MLLTDLQFIVIHFTPPDLGKFFTVKVKLAFLHEILNYNGTFFTMSVELQ